MLIKCPNCNAQYEVPNDIIPATGRDVQCSSCSKTWFVTGQSGKKIVKDKASNYKSQEKGELPKFETTESFLKDKSIKDIDADVLEILKEEADLEIRTREADRNENSAARKPLSKRAIKNSTKYNRKAHDKILPNNIEIGTTLEETSAPNSLDEVSEKSKAKSGKVGFFIGLAIIGVCWAAFTYEDLITQSMPQAAAYIEIENKGKTYWGVGINPNTTRASFDAIIVGLSKLLKT